LENRITKTETRQKMIMWFAPVIIGVTAILVGVI